MPETSPIPPSSLENQILLETTGKVLVVDDELANRRLLHDILTKQGHEISQAEDGVIALDAIQKDPPDVVLLDVMMPNLDGFEVCRRLKADTNTAHIPVILVTALSDRDDRRTGIAAGANEFLSKPIDLKEVQLRVKNAISRKKAYDRIQEDYLKLRELEVLRDNLIEMVVHDMRSPLLCISSYLELWQHSVSAEDRNCETGTFVRDALSQTSRLVGMVSDLLDVSRLEGRELPLTRSIGPLIPTIEEAVQIACPGDDGTRIVIQDETNAIEFSYDRHIILRVLTNLLSNAMKFSMSLTNPVTVKIREEGDMVGCSVTDLGAGMTEEDASRVFDKFFQAEAGKKANVPSTGLGLTFCKLALEAHKGEIGVNSKLGEGSTFWFTLPKN